MLRVAVAIALLPLGLGGCSATLVAASVGAVSTASVATYDCDAHVAVTIRDRRGNLHCGAPLEARRGDTSRHFDSCGWVSLGPGTWRVRQAGAASQSGVALSIEPTRGCDHAVYTVELDGERGRRVGANPPSRVE